MSDILRLSSKLPDPLLHPLVFLCFLVSAVICYCIFLWAAKPTVSRYRARRFPEHRRRPPLLILDVSGLLMGASALLLGCSCVLGKRLGSPRLAQE